MKSAVWMTFLLMGAAVSFSIPPAMSSSPVCPIDFKTVLQWGERPAGTISTQEGLGFFAFEPDGGWVGDPVAGILGSLTGQQEDGGFTGVMHIRKLCGIIEEFVACLERTIRESGWNLDDVLGCIPDEP